MKLTYRIRRGPFWIVFAVLILINIAMQATTGGTAIAAFSCWCGWRCWRLSGWQSASGVCAIWRNRLGCVC